jgi:hypothetical protein
VRVKVWTLRLEGERKPFLWQTLEGPATQQEVEAVIEQVKAQGLTVIVELKSKKGRRE